MTTRRRTELRRDGQHRYWYRDAEGEPERRLISVTTAIKAAGMIDAGMLRYSSQERLDRGRIIHRIAELEMTDTLDPATVDPALQPYHDALRRFRDHYRPVTTHVEHLVCKPQWGLAGALDWAGIVRPRGGIERSVLLDWKSYGYAPWHAVQVYGGYRTMLTQETGLDYEAWVVTLYETGQFNIKTIDADGEHVSAMVGAAQVAHWKEKYAA